MIKDTPERITLKKLWTDILEQLNLERGLGYTIKQFLLRPGKASREYLYENREIYTKPFSFLLLTTAVTTFLMVQFVISQSPGGTNFNLDPDELEKIPELIRPGIAMLIKFTKKYFNLFYLSNLPGVAVASYIILRKKCDYNLAELIVINTFIFSIQSILYLLNIPFFASEKATALASIPTLLLAGYFVFAFKQVFQLSFWQAVWYSLLVYVIAQAFNMVIFGFIVLIGMFYA